MVNPAPTPPNSLRPAQPVQPASPLPQAGGTQSQPASAGGAVVNNAAAAVRTVSAETLVSFLQTLGRPVSGTTQAGGSSTQLPVLLNTGVPGSGVPSSASPGSPSGAAANTGASQNSALPLNTLQTAATTTRTVIPLPAGSSTIPAGILISIEATPLPSAQARSSAAPSSQQPPSGLTVTVHGAPATSQPSLASAAGRQLPVSQLFAQLAQITAAGSNGGASVGQPLHNAPALLQAAGQLLGLALDADAVSARTLQTSTTASSLPTAPSQLSTPLQSHTSGVRASGDLATALNAFVRALGLTNGASSAHTAAGTPSQTPGSATSGSIPSGGNSGISSALVAGQQTGQSSSAASASAASTTSPTPIPDGALDLSNPAELQALRAKAEGALARSQILQAIGGTEDLASLRSDAATVQRGEVPFMLGQEATVFSYHAERDRKGSDGSDAQTKRSWRFRFSFESFVYGGIEGLVALHLPSDTSTGEPGLNVAVWADEENVRDTLIASKEGVLSALRLLGFTIDSLTVTAPRENFAEDGSASSSTHLSKTHLVDVAS
ncbi:MAG: hypothetical protein AAF590_07820 [Pseudomonadota bacterium]